MKKVAVIGGGFAGLSAAARLAQADISVELFESSPNLGGKAFSFIDKFSGDEIDNGQHIMMGCYKETIQFLKLINTNDELLFQEKLEVNFLENEKAPFKLEAFTNIYPFNLVVGIMSYKAISPLERLNVIQLFLKIIAAPSTYINDFTVQEWLRKENQSKRAIKSFWEILVIGALNTSIEKASAKLFIDILKQMFLNGNTAATIILPKSNLNNMYCKEASNYITNKGGKISLSSKITSIKKTAGKIKSIVVKDKEKKEYDFIISAIPYYSFCKLFRDVLDENSLSLNYNYSPIVNVHIWLKENPFHKKFYGVINSTVQWIFNHEKYITVTISNAEGIATLSSEEIFNHILNELIFLNKKLKKEFVIHYRVIKEKRATFIPEPGILKKRLSSRTKIDNLFLAGDWTNTCLPATIEGAIKSGKAAADMILSEI